MIIKIAIIDDNPSYIKMMSLLIQNLRMPYINVDISAFNKPEEYIEYNQNFDIVIIDCIFKNSNMTGLNLGKEVKAKSNSYVILTSAFAKADFTPIIMEQNSFIDHFENKEIDNERILTKITQFINEISENSKSKLKDVFLKLHNYKKKKELVSLMDINYARSKSREKHLMEVNTVNGELVLSMTLNNFISSINTEVEKKGVRLFQRKRKQDLFVNELNIIEEDAESIKFQDGTILELQ